MLFRSQNNYDKAQTNQRGSSSAAPVFEGRQSYEQAIANSMPPQEKRQPIIAESRVGRNDPCPCGSGKKYKACHGREQE